MRPNFKVLALDKLVVAAVQNILDQEQVDPELKQYWLQENAWFESKLAAVSETLRDEERVCPFFMKGKCAHPTRCRWLHPVPQQRNSPSVSVRSSQIYPLVTNETLVCPLYGQGKCAFGNSCPYKHPISQQSMAQANSGLADGYDSHSYGPPLNRYSNYVDDFSQSNEPCRMWQDSYCSNDACPFLHMGPPGRDHGHTQQRFVGRREYTPKERAKIPESSGKICRFWQRGGCFLKDCIFPHIGPSGMQQQESPDGDVKLKRERIVPSNDADESKPVHLKRPKLEENYPR